MPSALSEISHRVGLPKSTVHRLANQLCAVGWLERNSGGYRVGLRLLELGSVALQRTGLREAAFKHLHSLALRTGLVVHLGILDHGEVVYLDRVTTTRVSLPTRVGGREPAYCTALGKVMLAFEDPASQASALAGMRRRTEFTVVEPRAIQAALDSARQTGIAYDREEAYKGLGCVASPIRCGGRVIGALSVTGPDRQDPGALPGPRGAQHRRRDLVPATWCRCRGRWRARASPRPARVTPLPFGLMCVLSLAAGEAHRDLDELVFLPADELAAAGLDEDLGAGHAVLARLDLRVLRKLE